MRFSKGCKKIVAFMLVVMLTLAAVWTDNLVKREKIKAEPIDDKLYIQMYDDEQLSGSYSEYTVDESGKIEIEPETLLKVSGEGEYDYAEILQNKDSEFVFNGWFTYDESGCTEIGKSTDLLPVSGLVYAKWEKNITIGNIETVKDKLSVKDGTPVVLSVVGDRITINNVSIKDTYKDKYLLSYLEGGTLTELSRNSINGVSEINADLKIAKELAKFESAEGVIYNEETNTMYVNSVTNLNGISVSGIEGITYRLNGAEGEERKLKTDGDKLNELVITDGVFESEKIKFYAELDEKGPDFSDIKLGSKEIASGETYTYPDFTNNELLIQLKVSDEVETEKVVYTVNDTEYSALADEENAGFYQVKIPEYNEEEQKVVSYQFNITATDVLGNSNSTQFMINVKRDQTGPTVSVNVEGDSAESLETNQNIELGVDASDGEGGSGIDSIQYKINDGEEKTLSGGTIVLECEAGHTADYRVCVWAKDGLGNVSDTKIVNVMIDKDIPVIAEYTSQNEWMTGSLNEIELTATEKQEGVGNNAFKVSGEVLNAKSVTAGETYRDSEDSTKYHAIYSVESSITSDMVKFTAEFKDAVGNAVTKEIPLKIDINRPVTEPVVLSKDGVVLTDLSKKVNGKINVEVIATDVGSGVASVSYKRGSDIIMLESVTDGVYTKEIDTAELTDGENHFVFVVKDTAGNQSEEKEIVIWIDNTTPQFDVNVSAGNENEYNAEGNYYQNLRFDFSQLGDENDIEGYYYATLESAAVNERIRIENPYVISREELTNGKKTFYFWALDDAGNWSDAFIKKEMNIDVSNPVIGTIDVTLDNEEIEAVGGVYYTNQNTVIVSCQASDFEGGSGIRKVEYSTQEDFSDDTKIVQMDLDDMKYSKLINLSDSVGSEKEIFIRATDHVNNRSTVKSVKLYYDNKEAKSSVIAKDADGNTINQEGFTDSSVIHYTIVPDVNDKMIREVKVCQTGDDTVIGNAVSVNGGEYFTYTINTSAFVSGESYDYTFELVRYSKTTDMSSHKFTFDNKSPTLAIEVKADLKKEGSKDFTDDIKNDIHSDTSLNMSIKSFVNWLPKFVLTYDDDTAIELYRYQYKGISKEVMKSLTYQDLEKINDSWVKVVYNEEKSTEIVMDYNSSDTYLEIYKAVDSVGHTTYASSNGMIYDNDEPTISQANKVSEWINASNYTRIDEEINNTVFSFDVKDDYSGIDTDTLQVYQQVVEPVNVRFNLSDKIEMKKIDENHIEFGIQTEQLDDGQYLLYSEIQDNVANSMKLPVLIKKDLVLPKVEWMTGYSNPDDGTWINKENEHLEGSDQIIVQIYDPGEDKNGINTASGIKKIAVYEEKEGTRNELAASAYHISKDENNVRLVTVTTAKLEDGDYQLVFEAEDLAGNSDRIEIHVLKDTDLPVCRIAAISESGYEDVSADWTNQPKDIEITLTSKLSGFDSYKIVKKNISTGLEEKIYDEYMTSERITDSYLGETKSFTIKAEDLDEGNYLIYVTATDRSGNVCEGSKEVRIDRTSPEFDSFIYSRDDLWSGDTDQSDIISIESDTNPDKTIKCSGIKKIEYYINGKDEPFDTVQFDVEKTVHHEYTISWGSLEDGEYEVKAILYDHAGNITESEGRTVKKDTTAPTGEIKLGSDNSWTSFIDTITFGIFEKETQIFEITTKDPADLAVNESVSGIKEVYYLKVNVNDVYHSVEELPKEGWVKLVNANSNSIEIKPNEDVAINLKIVDEVENVTYINSMGVVVDQLGVNTNEDGSKMTAMTSYMREESAVSKTAFAGVDSEWTSEPDDIKIVLSDNLSGFESFEVYKESLTGTKEYVFNDERGRLLSYTDSDKVITSNSGEKVEFTIPGISLDEGDYFIVVKALDRSKNEEFIERQEVKIDRTAPVFNEFSYLHTETNTSRHNIWTNADNQADIISRESDANANSSIKCSGIEHIEYYVNNSTSPYYSVKFGAERIYNHEYKIPWENLRDGEYKVDAVIYDFAGNSSKATTIIVKKDTVAPVVSLDYKKHDLWTNEAGKADITSTESDATSARSKGSGIEHIDYYINGNAEVYQTDRFTDDAKEYRHSRVIPWSVLVDGNYTVRAVVYDHAGNYSEATRIVKKDTIYPSGTISLGENSWSSVLTTISFGIFKNETQTFHIMTDDPGNDGINENSKVKETSYLKTNVVYVSKESLPTTGWIKLANGVSDNITVAPNEDVIIYLRIEDHAGNVTYINSNGVVIDDRKPSGDIEKPTATIYAEPITNDIYKNSVKVRFSVQDPDTNFVRSGLDFVRYTIINHDTGYSETAQRNVLSDITGGNNDNATKSQLEAASAYSEEFVVDITNFNSNHVVIRLEAADNAGNVMDQIELPLKLDNTKPIVNVSYDNNTVGGYEKYFNADRVMTVAVTERNFDANATKIYISKDGVETTIIPGAEEWSHVDNSAMLSNGDSDLWIYRYTCNENVDYKVRVECADGAGNICENYNYEGPAAQEFTVDKNLPTITVNDKNGYSSEAVILTATITDHNFDPRDAIVLVTRKLNGAVLYSEQAYNAGWNSNGDVHTATLTFAEDGDYTFTVSFKDMAGNEAVTYTSSEFTVDTVDPKLTSNISADNKNIANKGNINFEFVYTDINSSNDAGMITYSVTTLAGKKVTDWIPLITSVNVGNVNGYTIVFNDLAAESVLKDGIYSIEVTVKDKAGRTVTENHQFSVNRYGSAYSYKTGEYTESVVTNRYVKEVTQDIELLVMNCDEITDYQVIVYNSLNEQTILTEDGSSENDYSFSEQDDSYIFKDSSENRDAGFKLYTCKIHKKVFEKEGTYTIVVATKDEADDSLYGENATLVNNTDAADNTISVTSNLETAPADEVVFTVDKTVPEAVIIGLKNNQTYELAQEFSVYYADANEIQSIVIERMDGNRSIEKTELTKEEISGMGIKTGELTHTAKEYNDYQTVKVTVVDAAGNEGVAEVRVLITSSFWVRFINNTPLLIGTIVGAIAIIGLIIIIILRRKKKVPPAPVKSAM